MDSRGFFTPDEGIFRGISDYFSLLERGMKPAQLIRIYNYGALAGDEILLAVGLEGKLYDENKELVDVSFLEGPDGYSLEGGFGLGFLPDEVVNQVLV